MQGRSRNRRCSDGRQRIERAHRERSNADPWNCSNHQVPLSDESPILPWLVDHAGCILSRCQKGRDGKTPFERLHGKRPTQEFVPFGEKVLAKQVSTDPTNRMNPRYKFGLWLGISAECFIGTADGVFRARDVRRLEPKSRWHKEAVNNLIAVLWRMIDGRFEGARMQRESITKQDIEKFGATVRCQVCNAIKDNKRAQAHSDRCRERIERCLRVTPQGAERLDRRNEVINEALVEEVQRAEQRKRRVDEAAATVPESEPATLASQDLSESPVEPHPDLKRRLLMKSALSAASHSGQQL